MKSMTGYGRHIATFGGTELTVEIKSVNNRYLETSVKLPRAYMFLEDKIKKTVQEYVSRGKADVFLTFRRIEGSDKKVSVDTALAGEYLSALTSASESLSLRNDISVSTLFRIPDVFTVLEEKEDEEALWNFVSETLKEALVRYNEMRETEGEKLKKDILSRLEFIENTADEIEKENKETVNAYRERLYEKIKAVLSDRTIDDARVLQEVAIFSDKVCVNEEVIRLHSHSSQFRSIMESAEPVGKKLDFLTQELNREANTTGSKCQDARVTEKVIALKSEIEKIREQIQNIE